MSYYLVMQIDHVVSDNIILYQKTDLKKLLDHFKIFDCKLVSILMDPNIANFLLPYNSNTDKETTKLY